MLFRSALGSNRLALGGNSSTTFGGALTGSGTLAKSGTGKLTLSGTSGAFAGLIDVLGGSMLVTGSHAMGSLSLASVASLGGSGFVTTGTVSAAGLIEPGDSPGILTIDGALAPVASTSFAFEMTGTGLPIWNMAANSRNEIGRAHV